MTSAPLVVTRQEWLCAHTFEVRFQRPPGFDFIPGQKVRFDYQDISREYTLVNALHDDHLSICVRHIAHGRFSPILARSKKGDVFQVTRAFGYFAYLPSRLPAVFVATGTGIAPFAAFARSGARGFRLLHGVHTTAQLYYRDLLEKTSASYTACLSADKVLDASVPQPFMGRVTDYMKHELPNGTYDFYLCGRAEMVADATRIIDRQFEGSKIFTETYY